MNILPVIFATDSNYAEYTYVAVLSCLHTKSSSSKYHFYILVSQDVCDSQKSAFMALLQDWPDCAISFIEMQDSFSTTSLLISHISTPTYYRLKLASLLPDVDKAIYLDSDIIVRDDLQALFNSELGDKCIAGVRAAGYITNESNRSYYRELGVEDLSGYINAGMTIWNLRRIRELKKEPELIALVEKGLKSMDQDAINIAFHKEIHHLPLKYNMMVSYVDRIKNAETRDAYEKIYGADELAEALASPVIVHYAHKVKPWHGLDVPMARFWWDCLQNAHPHVRRIIEARASVYREMHGALETARRDNLNVQPEQLRQNRTLFDELQMRISKISGHVDNLESHRKGMQEQIQQSRAQSAELNARISKVSTHVNELEIRRKEMLEQLHQNRMRFGDVNERISKISALAGNLETRRKEMLEQLHQHRTRLGSVNERIGKISVHVDSLESRTKENRELNLHLKSDLETLEKEQARTNCVLSEQHSEAAAMLARLDSLSNQLKTLESQAAETTQANMRLQKEMKQVQEKHSREIALLLNAPELRMLHFYYRIATFFSWGKRRKKHKTKVANLQQQLQRIREIKQVK